MAVKKRANRRNAAEVTADGVDTATGATTGSNDNNDANEATEPNDAPNQRSENSTKSTAIQHLYSRITLLFLQIYFYFYNFLSFGIYAKVDRGSQFSNRILILGDENALGVGDEAGFMTRKGLVKYLVGLCLIRGTLIHNSRSGSCITKRILDRHGNLQLRL